MTLGHYIKTQRLQLNLSQPQLAQRASIEQSYLSKLENDLSVPSDDILKRLLDALDSDIAQMCKQLDANTLSGKLAAIDSVRSHLQVRHQRQQRSFTLKLVLCTCLIGLGVAMFYAGHSKVFFPNTLYTYSSDGEIRPDEPIDYFEHGWGRPFESNVGLTIENQEQARRAARIERGIRVDYHTIRSFQPLDARFVRELSNGNRRLYRQQPGTQVVQRTGNAWLIFIGLFTAVSSLIWLMITLKLKDS